MQVGSKYINDSKAAQMQTHLQGDIAFLFERA